MEASILFKCHPPPSDPSARGLEGFSCWVLNRTEGMLNYLPFLLTPAARREGRDLCVITALCPLHFVDIF